jgi:hypothetical protein
VNRRTFLIAATSTALALSAHALFPQLARLEANIIEAVVGGRRLRGTQHGQVLESLDDGASWQVVSKFGDHCAVKAFAEREARIYARIHVQGHPFVLCSTDARTWRTADPDVAPL